MDTIKNIKIADYYYELPNNKIAYEPLQPKDASKLLVYKNNEILDAHFKDVAEYLPSDSLLFFNNSKVIPARLQFYSANNACIELFLLEPILPNNYELALGKIDTNTCIWKCFVGNRKKWKTESITQVIELLNCNLTATLIKKTEDAFQIKFNWDATISFSEIIGAMGKIPLPPYIKREAMESDKVTYQTVYAKINGSVAAPTAGLHFTSQTFASLATKKINLGQATLHVGAGTFQPVKATNIGDHPMHSEYFTIELQELQKLLHSNTIIAVGTTSCRMLESLYWLGVKLHNNPTNIEVLSIQQWEVYEPSIQHITNKRQAIQSLLNYCEYHQLQSIECNTQILIAPSYQFKITDILITNFHQPNSTLLLLISAFIMDSTINNKSWKTIYDHALHHDYRFLSYGDSSVLFK